MTVALDTALPVIACRWGPSKGTSWPWTDQEVPMTAIITAFGQVAAAAGGRTMIVESKRVGRSPSNGAVERAVR